LTFSLLFGVDKICKVAQRVAIVVSHSRIVAILCRRSLQEGTKNGSYFESELKVRQVYEITDFGLT
jgi:hypothetical protein